LKDPVQAAILKNCKIADNKANADDKRVSDITYHDFVKLVNSREDTSKIISDKSPRRMLASEFREERGWGQGPHLLPSFACHNRPQESSFSI
jgi:hypothetical protein